ncbi:Ger(x)C family spore germination protein [Ruminiclostridium papyrosolvens]|uniref:Germination protein Ger(X)C n=1 Tax=Ruminiclostridium papyrosolvens C7 TaxID=1330534 RepID=U4QX99_9FIRM|nr:Ger(x)C family spore germination protein [Ruminiclostridium papyrosolvens]EPR08302.1 germination protein Ger(x)C [Ruminiclostridium papyrosolvens C7]
MIKKVILLLLCISMIMTLTTGCWNNRDLSELSILTAMGIDQTEDGKIMVTAQIIKPVDVSSSGAGVSGGGGGGEKSFVVVSNTESTIFAALRTMLAKINKKIFYSSSQVIVFSEDLAKSGIKNYVDFILRDHETQFKSLIVVAKGTTAKEIVEQEYGLSKIPGGYIRDTIKNSKSRGFTKELRLLDMARELATEGRELSIGTIEKSENLTSTEGLAVFQKDKMVGWLDKYETRGYMFITGRAKSGIIEIESPDNPKEIIGIELMKGSSKIEVNSSSNNSIEVNVKIKAEGNVGEQQSQSGQSPDKICKSLSKCLEKQITKECYSAISKCQNEYKSDIFGFGIHVFDKYPKYWQKVTSVWSEEIFPSIQVKVKVDAKINRTGLLSKTIKIR